MTPHFKLPLIALAGALSIAGAASAQTAANSPTAATPAPSDAQAAPADAAKPARMTREEKNARKAADKAAAKAARDGTAAAPAATAPAAPAATPRAAGTPAAGTPSTAAPAADAAVPPNPAVGGVAMDAGKTIAANASAAPNLSTLVKAATAAGLVSTLSGPGPFTVFAPTNDAFGRLAPGTVDTLLLPANKALLTKALTYHVVPGTITAAQLLAQIEAGGGKATLTTVEGSPLTVTKEVQAVVLTDVNGNKSYIETPDVRQSNGIVHVVNGVLLPKMN